MKWRKFEVADIKYDIIEEIGVLSENGRGWRKELNLISWNGAAPKFDLRDWGPDHSRMGKGITLNRQEAEVLSQLLRGKLG
ncbi:MAG: YdbC family protein [Anaerovoracaceae bacterium]